MIHMSYTNTPYYSQWPQVFAELKGLGVRHYRDGFYPWDPAKVPYYQRHQQLGAAGIRGDIIIPWNKVPYTAEQIVQFCHVATDCEVLEAPNEINASRMPDWADRLKATLPAVDQAAQQLNIPTYGPSFTKADAYTTVGNIADTMTFNNLHIYFGGRHPGSNGWGPRNYGSINYWKQLAEIDGPGKPSVVTETGYMTNETKPYDVPEDFQAAYLLRTLMEMQNAGMVRTYIYEFVDEASSPDYGIVRADLTPKPAYTGLKNLIQVLEDKGPRFTPGTLDYSLQGVGPEVHHLLMQKRDGTFYLALWIEQPGYDTAKAMRTPIAARPASLQLSGGASARSVIQMMKDGSVVKKPAEAGNIPLNLTDDITIIEIGGGKDAPASNRRGPRAH